MYTVKQAAALTGVPEATLRAWERRYAIVTPERTPGGYRLYDDSQLEILRTMSALVRDGVPASRAAETVRHGRASHTSDIVNAPTDDLIAVARSLDPVRLEAALTEAFEDGEFAHVADRWLLPELARMGEAWVAGDLTVAQEHFATVGVMRQLYRFLGAGPAQIPPSGPAPSVVLGLPAGARHEMGLLSFAVTLHQCGLRVIYLGADVPEDEWLRVVNYLMPRAVVLGAASDADAAACQAVVDQLQSLSPPVMVLVGGSGRTGVRGAHLLPDSLEKASALLDNVLRAGVSPEQPGATAR